VTLLFSAVAAGTNGGAVTTGNSPFTNLVTPGAWTYSNTRVVPGYGATVAWRATASSSTALANAGSAVWTSTPITFWDVAFDVEALPSTNETILPFRNVGTAIGDLRITTAGAVQIRDGGFAQRAISGAIATVGKAVRAQVKVDSTNSKMQLRVAVGSANIAAGTWDYDSGLVAASSLQPTTNFQLGLINSGTATVHFTALAVSDSAYPGPSGNLPPTCSASASPTTAAAGATVTLSGTDSDPDGTIASRAWTQTSGTTVTLTGASTATATFTAPSVSGGATLGFLYTVTDNLGATATSTVSVTVTSSTASVAYRDSAQATNTGTGAATSVTIPGTVVVGDKMLAVFMDGGGNLTESLTSGGWVTVDSAVSAANFGLHIWQKTAVAGDAGSTLTVTSSLDGATVSKRTFVVVAYSGARLGNAKAIPESTAGTTHTAPGAVAVSANAWAVDVFMDRGSPGSTSIGVPAGWTVRQSFAHTGGAAITSTIADKATIGSGTVGAIVGTGTVSTANAAMATVILEPGTPSNPPPVTNAGVDQTGIEPWATVTVGGTDTARGTATVATRLWEQIGGADVTGSLSSTSTATVTFTAPPTIYGTSLILQKTVTDSTGAVGVDQVQVDVLPVTERAVVGMAEIPGRFFAVL
jgi:hypothetical protein